MGTVNRDRREATRRAFHAAWQKPIEKLECTAEALRELRRDLLNLSQRDAARLLRVATSSIKNWESGAYPAPFTYYLALLLVSESQRYRAPSAPAWRDWQFTDRYDPQTKKTESVMVNAAGLSFTLAQLEDFAMALQKAEWLKLSGAALQAKVEALTSENQEIREQFRDSGVTAELHDMRKNLDALLAQLPFAKAAS